METHSIKYPTDSRVFTYGEIYKIKDELVSFPEEKYTKGRTKHNSRLVCIIHHCESNSDKYIWTINAAPLSSQVRMKRDTDLEISPTGGNYIDRDSLIRLGAAQPFLKNDLKGPVGTLSEEQLLMLSALQAKLAGIDLGIEETE